MSAVTAESGQSEEIRGAPAPFVFQLYAAVLLMAAIVALGLTWILNSTGTRLDAAVLPWIVAVGVAGALPIRTEKSVSLAFDLPVLLAVGFTLGPVPAGVAALLGTVDLDELRGRGSVWLSICNRAQTALATMAAALVFRASDASLGTWPTVGMAAILALLADAAVNYGLVAAGVALFRSVGMSTVLQDMRIGALNSFVIEYACVGLLGILLAETYQAIGISSLFVFVVPLVLAHGLFKLRKGSDEARVALDAKSEAILSLSKRIADERRDERLVVAGELHDEVLPPLTRVHLMGQVIRQDLASGRLLDLDQDLPDLLQATDAAQEAVRQVVASLRKSPLGPSGLAAAIQLLAEQLEGAGAPRFELSVDDDEGSDLSQLLMYQVLREAMENAARHSRGGKVRVSVRSEEGALRGVVEDDGVGFLSGATDSSAHFGLQLMRERVAAAGGQVVVDSRLGHGTCVSVAVPLNA